MKSKIIAFLVVLILVILLVRYYADISTLLSGNSLQSYIASFGPLASVVYILLYIVITAMFIPVSPLSLLGGVLFGTIYGAIFNLIGGTIGAYLGFLIARRFGEKVLRFGDSSIAKKIAPYEDKLLKHGFLTVLFLRLVPLFPFNGLNFGLGLTRVSNRQYFLGTLFGIIPGTFAFAFFGDALQGGNIKEIGLGILAIVALGLFGRFILRKFSKNIKHEK